MALDPTANFSYSTFDGDSGIDADDTSVTLASGSSFPDPASGNYNLVIWDVSTYSNPAVAYANSAAEIVRATAKTSNTLTITRAQESTTARAFNTTGKTYAVALMLTDKMIDDINSTFAPLTSPGFTTAANPVSSDAASLGTTSLMWSDVFLAVGAVINFNNGDVTITHGTNRLDFEGASSGFTFAGGPVRPASNDAVALGSTSNSWADLFLASGGTINWNSGNAIITHSAGLLTSNVDIAVPDEAYGAGWNGSTEVPTKNAVYDKIETLGSSSGFDATTTVELYDDFVSGDTSSGEVGALGWTFNNGTTGGSIEISNETGSYGALTVNSGSNAGDGIGVSLNGGKTSSYGTFGSALAANTTLIMSLQTGTTTNQEIYAGLIRMTIGDNSGPDEGVYFELVTDTNANWRGVCKNGAGTSYTASSFAPSTSFKQFKIVVNSDKTSIEFFADGSSLGTITTNIPTNSLGPTFKVRRAASGVTTLNVDYFWAKITGLSR